MTGKTCASVRKLNKNNYFFQIFIRNCVIMQFFKKKVKVIAGLKIIMKYKIII